MDRLTVRMIYSGYLGACYICFWYLGPENLWPGSANTLPLFVGSTGARFRGEEEFHVFGGKNIHVLWGLCVGH